MNIVYTIRNFLCFRWLWKESKDTKILSQDKPVNVTNKDNKVIGSVKPSKIIQTVFGKGKDKE